MIVGLHVLGQGGILKSVQDLTFKGEIFWGLEILFYGAVNVYAIISGYVGYKTKHKATNLINLCLQMLFFAIVITGVDLVFAIKNGTAISIKETILNIFPTIRKYWYFSAYFCLFFFMPLLDKIIECVSRKTLKIVALFIFIVFCCFTQLYSSVANLKSGYSVLWLGILYLVGAYFKKYNSLEKWSALKCLLAFIILTILTIISRSVIGLLTKAVFGEYKLINFFVSYTSPTITLASVFMFTAFTKLKLNKTANKVIAFLAPLAFGIYVIHCHPILFAKLNSSFVWITNQPEILGILLVFAISLAIFVVCIIVDYLRLLLFKICKMDKFAKWIAKVVQGFTNFIFKILKIKLEDDVE